MNVQKNNKYNFSTTPITIPVCFSMDDVVLLESLVINKIKLDGGEIEVPEKHYFLEPVAIYLWNCYQNAKTEPLKTTTKQELLTYLLLLVDKVLRGNTKWLNGMDYEELFQELFCHIAKQIDRYKPEKGKIYSFVTVKLHYHIMTITIDNYNEKVFNDKRTTDIGTYEIGLETNQNNWIDFMVVLKSLTERPNTSNEFRVVFKYILAKIESGEVERLVNGLVYNIWLNTKIKRTMINDALDYLRHEVGTIELGSSYIEYNKEEDYK
jgi:hypothetical protein